MNKTQLILLLAVLLLVGLVVAAKLRQPTGTPSDVPGQGLPRLTDLGSTTCSACKRMAPILEELKTELAGRVDVEFIDIIKSPQATERYDVKIIPTQIFFDASGNEVARHEGFMSKADILAQLQQMGVDVR